MKLLKSLMCQIQSHPKKGSRKITMVIKRFLTCDSFLKSNVFTGVDNDRFLGRRANPATVAAISKSNEEEDFESREAIYDARRAEIQYQFRYCNNYKAVLIINYYFLLIHSIFKRFSRGLGINFSL